LQQSPKRCIGGIEAMAMMVKKQTHHLRLSILEQVQFVKKLFHVHSQTSQIIQL
jgi:hypothetical protein